MSPLLSIYLEHVITFVLILMRVPECMNPAPAFCHRPSLQLVISRVSSRSASSLNRIGTWLASPTVWALVLNYWRNKRNT